VSRNKIQFNALRERIRNITPETLAKLENVVESNAQELRGNALQRAPVADGELRRGIKVEIPENDDKYNIVRKVVSNAPHSPFIEFGTKTYVSIPPEFQKMASEIRSGGRKPKAGSAWDRISGWARKKGKSEAEAYLIYMKIMNYGVDAQPFMYPAFVIQRNKFFNSVKKALEDV